MDSILDTLIFDRTQADVDRAKYLNGLWDARTGRWMGTAEEWAEWEAGPRGAYGWRDMNRVTEAVAYLVGQLSGMGYGVDIENVTPAYNIRVLASPAGGGAASGSGVYYDGTEAVVSAQPGEKYDFAGWMENGALVSEELVYTFTVERSRNLAAAFVLKQFRVEVGVEPDGSGEAGGAGVYDIDTEVTVAASAGEGYVFARWTEGGETVSEGPEYVFVLDRDRSLRAVMTKTHVISVSASDDDGGTVTGGGTFLDGQTVTVAAVAGEGYEFTGWQEDGRMVSGEAVYSFPAATDRELAAVFVRTHVVTLLVSPDGWGTAAGGGTYREGEQITVTAAAESDYRFVEWMDDGEQVSTSPAYTFTITGRRRLTAVFEKIPVYTVTVTIDPPGSGTATGAGQYKEGERVAVRAAPADGYQFAQWTINGQDVSTGESYTFTVAEDMTITAKFAEVPKWELKWVSATMPAKAPYQALAYGLGRYVAVASNTAYTDTAYSADCAAWTEGGAGGKYHFVDMAFGDGKFMAVSSAYSNVSRAAFSTNGTSWSTRSIVGGNVSVQSVAYGAGKFVFVGGSGNAYSLPSDFSAQTSVTTSALPASGTYRRIRFVNNVFLTAKTNSDVAAYSADGISWSQITLPVSGDWYGIAGGGGKYVIVAYNSKTVLYSENLTDWEICEMPRISYWTSAVYSNGKFIAVDYNSNAGAAYSLDGKAWVLGDPIPTSSVIVPQWYNIEAGSDRVFTTSMAPGDNAAAYALTK